MSTTVAGEFDVEAFEQKLHSLKDTQDSIQQLSAWCLQQRQFHKKIVSSWLNVLKQARVEHRLTLFYLANDVIQYSKRKNYEFVESWSTALQKATTMVRDDKVRVKIFRIFKIWEQREIYTEEYLSDLNGLLSMNPTKKQQQQPSQQQQQQTTPQKEQSSSQKQHHQQQNTELLDEFQNSILISNIKECVKLEKSTDKNFKNLPRLPNCDIEAIKTNLKDRSHSDDAEKDIDDYVTALEKYIKSLKYEIKSRKQLITRVVQAETFFTNQRSEVKVVVNAYRNFGNRIKTFKKKLDEITPNLPSPIPSPDINAPSPEQDADDIVLPDDQNDLSINMFKNSTNGYASYMDGNLPFDINDFKRDSPQKHSLLYDNRSNDTQPIQVINNRSEQSSDDYNLNDFFKPNDPYTPMDVPIPVASTSNYAMSCQPQSNTSYSNVGNSGSGSSGGGGGYSTNSSSSYNSDYNESVYSTRSTNSNYDTQMPLMPPPMPPLLGVGGDDFNSTWDMDMTWTSMNTTNNAFDSSSIDTPCSPPHFEREGANTDIVEYMESSLNENIISLRDVDHRQLHLPSSSSMGKEKGRTIDIDHRNLISLTGSPGPRQFENKRKSNSPKHHQQQQHSNAETDVDFRKMSSKISGDIDYRTQQNIQSQRYNQLPPPPPPPRNVQENLKEISTESFTSDDKEGLPIITATTLPNLGSRKSAERQESTSSSTSSTSLHPPPPLPSPLDSTLFSDNNLPLTPSSPTDFEPSKPPPHVGKFFENQNKSGFKKATVKDNVESIDMDMSDEDLQDYNEEEDDTQNLGNSAEENETDYNQQETTLTSSLPFNNQRPPLLQTPTDILPWSGRMSTNNNDNIMWKSNRMPVVSQFRMPNVGNIPQQFQQQQVQFANPRGMFIQSPRGFNNQQMKPNFISPRGSPYFNRGAGLGGRGSGTGGRRPYRGGFRGAKRWQ